MGLLAEIQNDALTDSTPVATMLRKMLVLASDIESNPLEEWVRHELAGYPLSADLPDYRLIKMRFTYTGNDGFRIMENLPIATRNVMVATKQSDINFLKYRKAIGSIDPNAMKSTHNLNIDMMNYAHLLSGTVIDRSVEILDFSGVLAASELYGIFEAVRNRALDFVLALKKTYPDAGEIEGLSTTKAEVSKIVTKIYYNTIHGNVGVAGDANNSTVNVTVNHGNLHGLRGELQKHGVDEADIIELEAALIEEPKIAADKRFGPRVGSWMGKMAGKAATGAWSIGVGAGSALLQAALLGYYGFSS
ncbi:hypothetical protein JZX86_27615 [Agrobacterium rosae]|uniref:AbiTii domain-containing protein n=1 Tax=Agrobacterium rosae TaxID=1972867 RepID=UPI0019D329A1|nr:hypothetical protein [Agrobacterium rosae]MBN7809091.1 hypothetical protein [Agrobacterium rosae]